MSLLHPPLPATPSSSSNGLTQWMPELVSDASDTSRAPSIGLEGTSQGILLQSPHRTVRIRPSQLLNYPIYRLRSQKTSFSPEIMARDRFLYKRKQALTLAQAYRARIAAEEQEAIRYAEEEAVLGSGDDFVQSLSGKRALKLARATREAVHASHKVALSRLQAAKEAIRRLEDQVEDTRNRVRIADLQVGEVLEALASVNYEGMNPEDLDPEPLEVADPADNAILDSTSSVFQKLPSSCTHTKIHSPSQGSDTDFSDNADQSESLDSEDYQSDS